MQEEKRVTEDDVWMASLTRGTWAWVSSGSCWWTGRPAVLRSKGSEMIEWLNWTEQPLSFNWSIESVIISDMIWLKSIITLIILLYFLIFFITFSIQFCYTRIVLVFHLISSIDSLIFLSFVILLISLELTTYNCDTHSNVK